VHLPEGAAKDASHFGIHPALLDAAIHALALDAMDSPLDVSLPFSWVGSRLYALGPSALRTRIARHPGRRSVAIAIADAWGEPVASIESLVLRPASKEQIQ